MSNRKPVVVTNVRSSLEKLERKETRIRKRLLRQYKTRLKNPNYMDTAIQGVATKLALAWSNV